MPSHVAHQIGQIRNLAGMRGLSSKTEVPCTESARLTFRALFNKCANIMDASAMTNNQQMSVFSDFVNRIAVRAKRIAACIAIANNPLRPEIDEETAHWACSFVMWHFHNVEKMICESSVDQDMLRRDYIARRAVTYLTMNNLPSKVTKYDQDLADMGYISGPVMSQFAYERPELFRSRVGSSSTIRQTIEQMTRTTGELLMTRIAGQVVYSLPDGGYRSPIRTPSIYNTDSEIYRICAP